ncbi:MAG TPA: S1/P1 nuclease [Sphingomonas sp.]|nr:S1/P1 nuclease [Sphingomonas sp.]
METSNGRRLGLAFIWGAALAAACVAAPAQAYWDYAHRTIAAIAWNQVTPQARARIRRLIAHAPELATPKCPIHSIQDASVWADCVKPGERYSYAYSWHFQNVDICKPFDIKSNCAFGNCVSAQITRNAKLLADRSLPMRERLQALAFLVHLVGDLHQPLHAGDRADLGGNKVVAHYGEVGGRINLHMIWDGYLAERAITSPPPGPLGILGMIAPGDRKAAASGTVEDWSRENWEVARDKVYAPVSGGDPCAADRPKRATVDEVRIEAAIPVLRLQMARGGLRLARLLDEALG